MSQVGTWNTNLLTWIVDTDAQLMNATVPSERIQWVISGGDRSAEGVWKKKWQIFIYRILRQLFYNTPIRNKKKFKGPNKIIVFSTSKIPEFLVSLTFGIQNVWFDNCKWSWSILCISSLTSSIYLMLNLSSSHSFSDSLYRTYPVFTSILFEFTADKKVIRKIKSYLNSRI